MLASFSLPLPGTSSERRARTWEKARMLSRMPGLFRESGFPPDQKSYLTWRCPVTPSRFSPKYPVVPNMNEKSEPAAGLKYTPASAMAVFPFRLPEGTS